MIVSDIYEDVKSITNFTDESLNFSRLSDAIEVISNKGNYDVLIGYYTVTAQDDIITLPRDVEVPLKVNIDGNPSFTRDRFFEFTLNGPGQSAERVDWSWEDRGTVPVARAIVVPEKVMVTGFAVDAGKIVTVYGRTRDRGTVESSQFILGTTTDPSNYIYSDISVVSKEPTTKAVNLTTESGILLSAYAPDETSPQYRQIRISKTGGTAYIMFRKNRSRISAQTDFIPIRSKMGLIYMVKALEAYREERLDVGKSLETTAIQLCNDEQNSHNAQIEIASQSESAQVLNLGYNNIDSIIVSDLYDDFCQICGPLGQDRIFDKITEALSVLSRKAQWDSLRGFVDIQTDQYQFVTLPRYVEYVIKVNINHQPSSMKNKWFEYNMNGPGEQWLPSHSWMDVGEVVTIRDVLYPIKLTAIPDLSNDNDTEIRVFGFSGGKRLQTINAQGVSEDGIIVPCNQAGTEYTVVSVDRIDRITKAKSNGFIKLKGIDSNGNNEIVIGYYYPDETEPKYRRIKLYTNCTRVRIMYRKRHLKISSLTDPIHLRSKTAVLAMAQAIEALGKGDSKKYDELESTAIKLLADENQINNQSDARTITFDHNLTPSDQFIMC